MLADFYINPAWSGVYIYRRSGGKKVVFWPGRNFLPVNKQVVKGGTFIFARAVYEKTTPDWGGLNILPEPASVLFLVIFQHFGTAGVA